MNRSTATGRSIAVRWALTVAAFLVSIAECTAAEKPNIVIIVSDDHGFGDIGWNNSAVKTPHLDRFASGGVRLDRFYVNPICSVTRAALMTGIILAGRTGASYAAQLGTMQVNEEIDAFRTLGVSPIDYLVLPRMVALIAMVPLLGSMPPYVQASRWLPRITVCSGCSRPGIVAMTFQIGRTA